MSEFLVPINRENSGIAQNIPNKVLQFGGGNFLRAFIDYMIQELNEKADFTGGIIVVKPTEKRDYSDLRIQDGLFHICTSGIAKGQEIDDIKLITCVQDIIHPYKEWEKYLQSAEENSIKFIFSNTTESGIKYSELDHYEDHPPAEFPAKLTHWLHHRYQHFQGEANAGCIILPCELIENNGRTLKKYILAYARLWELEEGFTTWIDKHNIFCNTLVDRIVTGFPSSRFEELQDRIGFEDSLLVSVEPYHQFVIQSDKDIRSELPFHKTDLNVVFTHDLNKYRSLKVRILNGAHTAMVPIGFLSGLEAVKETIEHTLVGQFIHGIVYDEILPSLNYENPIKSMYADEIMDRFKNPYIHHKLIDIALNSISKFKTRVLPSLLSYQEKKGILPERLVFAFASLIWFYRGFRGQEKIDLNDDPEVLNYFQDIWAQYGNQKINISQLAESILKKTEYWNQDLSQIEGLTEKLASKLDKFSNGGYTLDC